MGDILFIKADISSYHFRNSYIIRTIDPLGRNFPPAIVFAKDTSKAFSLSVNKVDNKLGIPDTAITGYFWAQKDPNKVDTARVEKYFPLGGWGYHDLVLGVEGDSTIRTEDWMKWILQFSRSGSTFRTQDSFQVDKPFDGNARLIDTVIFPRDTIPPVGVKQPGLLLEIKQNSVLPTIVKAACFRPELAGQNIYSANGRKVNKQTLTRSLSPGIYYVIKKDATSPKKLIVVR
ncbi:hypothetical protein CH330_04885 [candidate division WOR-3 bacterium JGI_Cruoil_03_51_56]|uniref:Uncharacterized protein n=1 Tax=candidate division WOR-3 bacterium JGI_Cruoil_03_51_56 TaxID=1973747 RepID=A0A235BU39_UNCW3|nr:MAG: hypothetical protein CH330_04885 [candidate division WOR-3 bacterium JGI_Cruoil_03_51_56]